MIGLGLGLQQVGAARLAFGVELANLRLFIIGEPRRHRPGRQEHRRQVPERKRADQKARHDLVADAEVDRGVEHVVRQRHRRRERNHVAGEKRELHALLALGHAIAHRRHAASDLRRAADGARRLFDEVGKAGEGLMGRQHVVVGGYDREIGSRSVAQGLLVAGRAGGEAVGEIGAAEPLAHRSLGDRGVDSIEIGAPRVAAPFSDPPGDFGDSGVEFGHA